MPRQGTAHTCLNGDLQEGLREERIYLAELCPATFHQWERTEAQKRITYS